MKEHEYIYTIYKEKSFSAAAQKLFVSQPALSMAIKKVEAELGIIIFDRSTVPLSLTEEGKVLIDAIEQMHSVQNSMKNRLADMTNLRSGHVVMSGENFVSSFILPKIIMNFSKDFPGIDISLVESNSPELRKQLLSENIDLLVAHDFNPKTYEAKELLNEDILLAVPENFEINIRLSKFSLTASDIIKDLHKSKGTVDLKEFANEKFLILKPGNDLYKRGMNICAESGFEPNISISLDQLITAYNLANSGLGITFVSDILIKKSPANGCLYYAIGSKYAHRTMYIGYKKGKHLNRAVKAFIDTAVKTYKEEI